MFFFEKFKHSSFLKTGLTYSVTSSFKSFVQMAIGILIVRWLNPTELGLWQSIAIFQAYIPFLQLGVQSGLNRDLPILLGKNDKEGAMRLVANAKCFSLIVSFFVLFSGGVTTIVLFFIGKSEDLVFGVLTITLMAVSNLFRQHLIATFRSSNSFNKLSVLSVIDAIVMVSLCFFVYKYKYYGILIYNAVSSMISMLLMQFFAPYRKERGRLNKKSIIPLIKGGIVLTAFSQGRDSIRTIPRWIVLRLGNLAELGLFSPALAVEGVMQTIPAQVAQFFHPQMGYRYGKSGRASDLWYYVKTILWLFPLISIPVSVAIWLISPWLLSTFFPKYIDSLWAMRIMSVGFVFSSAFTTHGILYTIRAYKPATLYIAIEALCYFVLPFSCVKLFKCDILTSVSIGYAVTQVLLYFLNILLLRKTLFDHKFNSVTE